ncbi:unnamed protein product [Gadus morhua 'NCC']
MPPPPPPPPGLDVLHVWGGLGVHIVTKSAHFDRYHSPHYPRPPPPPQQHRTAPQRHLLVDLQTHTSFSAPSSPNDPSPPPPPPPPHIHPPLSQTKGMLKVIWKQMLLRLSELHQSCQIPLK